ncbi:MAG: WD40 repeat domain-containing protein [Planctomycetes bacterium]|nr:WD40 repeat domain-containing protein [Planctomycetota bacterium]
MHRWAIAIAPLLVVCTFSAGQEAKKRPIPSKEAQAKIEKLLDELYKDDFAKSEKDPVLRARLAQTLLFEGKETKDDAAGRYVLFSKAHLLAAQAGDVNTALQAADELANDFVIASSVIFQMKIKMLQQASKVKGAPPDAYQSVIDRALLTLDDTLDSDDYPSSLALIESAEQAARKLRSLPLVVTIRKRQDEILRLQKAFGRWKPFADKLVKNPKDAEANFEMGKYHALIKGNWDRGLPLLANGSKGPLQSLARSDRANPATEKDRRVLALGWYLFGTGANTDAALKTQALLRAYHWYQENLAGADDKDRMLIESKLIEISNLLPAEYRIGEITTELKKIVVPTGPVYGCAFGPDGRRFIITGYDGNLHLFNTKTYKELKQYDGHAGKVWTVAYSADGKRVASGGFDNTVRLWDLAAGKAIKTFTGHKDYVRSVVISNDGKWILSGGDDRTMRLWNVADGTEQRAFVGHDHTVWCVALSRDGKQALSASLDRTARLWETGTGALLKKLEGHKDTVLCVAFFPDGRHAVTGSSDKTLRLWDLATGKTLQLFEGSNGYIQSVAVSPDGRRILSAGSDNVVRLWDAHTGKEIRKLEGHRDSVWHVAFSPDGRLAISSGQDNTVRIWSGAR